jgi:hypothetical protein
MPEKVIKVTKKELGDKEMNNFISGKVNRVKMSDIEGTADFNVKIDGMDVIVSYPDTKPLNKFTTRLKKLIKAGNPLVNAMK